MASNRRARDFNQLQYYAFNGVEQQEEFEIRNQRLAKIEGKIARDVNANARHVEARFRIASFLYETRKDSDYDNRLILRV